MKARTPLRSEAASAPAQNQLQRDKSARRAPAAPTRGAAASQRRSKLLSECGSTKQNIEGSLARNGKIARLPAVLREALNRALARGLTGPQVLEWLNDLPEIKALLRREFKGQPISPQNLSQWRQGGFRDWLRQQEAREVFCEFAARHQNLSALELNEKIALWLGTRMVCMTGHLEQLDPQESWPVVRQMVRDVATLRRGDHRIREQKFKERAKDKITREEHMQWAMEPGMLDWLVRQSMEREGQDAETTREIRYSLFGMLAGDDPEDLEWEARKRGVPIEQLDEARHAECRERWSKQVAGAPEAAKSALQTADSAAGEMAHKHVDQRQAATTKMKGAPSSYVQKLRRDKPARQARTIKGKTEAVVDQGNTEQIKANQSESKGNSRPAMTAQKANPMERGHSCPPNANQDGRTRDSRSCQELDTHADRDVRAPDQAGPVGHSGIAGITASVAAQPAAPIGNNCHPVITTRPVSFAYRCHCGARGACSAEECPNCHLRWSKGMPCCPCHQDVPAIENASARL